MTQFGLIQKLIYIFFGRSEHIEFYENVSVTALNPNANTLFTINEVQTFCNQCGEIVLQKLSEKICPYCKSEKWTRAEMTEEVKQMLVKMQQDPSFRYQIKLKYKKIWNEKFPKYAIPGPDNVGRMIPK